jgi:hypothetical protein
MITHLHSYSLLVVHTASELAKWTQHCQQVLLQKNVIRSLSQGDWC